MCCRYYCKPDAVVAGNANSAIYDCPRGYYCPTGTGYDYLPCPKGTFGSQVKLHQVITVILFGWPSCFNCIPFIFSLNSFLANPVLSPSRKINKRNNLHFLLIFMQLNSHSIYFNDYNSYKDCHSFNLFVKYEKSFYV